MSRPCFGRAGIEILNGTGEFFFAFSIMLSGAEHQTEPLATVVHTLTY